MVPPRAAPAKTPTPGQTGTLRPCVCPLLSSIVEAARSGLALHVPLRIVVHVTEPSYPGAIAPQRCTSVESLGVRLNLLEWGDPEAPPLVLTHGMWDHARSFAVFAPLLAEHFRVVAIDARGHGDSAWAGAYSWLTDILDVISVLRWVGRRAVLVGHSKGGGQATDAARAVPELVAKLVSIDGFGPPALDDDQPLPARFAAFLDQGRTRAQRDSWRPYASLDDLVERRRAQNPRLSRAWLRYLAFHGAREDGDGWRWKADPLMAHGVGPWRPEWIGPSYATLRVPMLAVTGSEPDTWGPLPEQVLAERLSRVPQLERRTISGAGHFVHIERPAETAQVVLDFLRS
jgi:pimeloyl-ACP methyl ester carboxylesterase